MGIKTFFVSCRQFIRSTVFISKAQWSTRCPEGTNINIAWMDCSLYSFYFVCKLIARNSFLLTQRVYYALTLFTSKQRPHIILLSFFLLQKTTMVSTSDDRCHKIHFPIKLQPASQDLISWRSKLLLLPTAKWNREGLAVRKQRSMAMWSFLQRVITYGDFIKVHSHDWKPLTLTRGDSLRAGNNRQVRETARSASDNLEVLDDTRRVSVTIFRTQTYRIAISGRSISNWGRTVTVTG